MSIQPQTRIDGGCHCNNIRFALDWPEVNPEIRGRACGCSFCQKHGSVWTSHRESILNTVIEDRSRISKYKMGTGTADFYVCSICGVVTFATCTIENTLYAVVNVNSFNAKDTMHIVISPTDFDGESTDHRLGRRKQNWIPVVSIVEHTPDD